MVLTQTSRFDFPVCKTSFPVQIHAVSLFPRLRSIRIRPIELSMTMSRSLFVFTSSSSGPRRTQETDGSPFPSIRTSSGPHGRIGRNSIWALREESTRISAVGWYTFPVMTMPPAFVSNPPHWIRARLFSHRCSALREIVNVSSVERSISIISILPEKFIGLFEAMVSNTWVTESSYTSSLLILTDMTSVVESSPTVGGMESGCLH